MRMRGDVIIAATAVLVALAGCAHKPVVNTAVMPTQKPKYDPHDAAAYNMQLGLAYMERGELAIAKEKLERAEREDPKDPNVHAALALLNERLGNTPKADEEFHTALSRAPHNPDIRNNYAVYLCRTKRTDQGVRELLEVAHDPLYTTPEVAYTNAGVCLRSEHRLDEAERSFLAAIALRPSFAEAVYQLADLEFDRKELVAARTRIDNYIATFTANPDLLLLGARIARAEGDRRAEQRYVQRLRVDFPDSDQTRAARPPNSP